VIFLSALIAIAVIYGFRTGSSWSGEVFFRRWHGYVARTLSGLPLFLVAVVLPTALIALLSWWLCVAVSPGALLLIYVPILLLSFGPCNFSRDIDQYLDAARRQDNVAAREWIDRFHEPVTVSRESAALSGWTQLHREALSTIGFVVLQRYFSVLFWFFVAGPAGALFYRLAAVHQEAAAIGTVDGEPVPRAAFSWRYWLDWPGSRLLMLSWALVGHFDQAIAVLKRGLFRRLPLSLWLGAGLTGALGAPVEPLVSVTVGDEAGHTANEQNRSLVLSNDATLFKVLTAVQPLLSRTLLLWVCASAVVALAF